jgi:phosphoribosylamine--glycine ligase
VTTPTRVCVVGTGGREHDVAEACSRAGATVLVTPGNAGIPWSCDVSPLEVSADIFIIGPERPLVEGLADRLRARGQLVLGPGADGARLEGSKAWMKDVVRAAGVPTADHGTFTRLDDALRFLDRMTDLYVIKTDGLADGKGVLVTGDRAEAADAVRRYLDGSAFGDAGRTVVIEEGLTGPEVSLLVVTDGTNAVPLAPAQDHKRLLDGDAGPNTGGMGAFSPVPDLAPTVVDQIMETAVLPTLAELRRRGIEYRGVLYAGIMLTPGGPKLLEFNVRLGDPEAQVIMPRLTSSFPELALEAATGRIIREPTFSPAAVVGVVLATAGYPTDPVLGHRIEGLPDPSAANNVYYSGVQMDRSGHLVTAGGRVLTVTGSGPTIELARADAYRRASRITWDGRQFRHDIGVTRVSVGGGADRSS